jgi:hypothetical protein
MQRHAHIHAHTRAQPFTRTHTHAHTRTNSHMHTDIQIHTHACARAPVASPPDHPPTLSRPRFHPRCPPCPRPCSALTSWSRCVGGLAGSRARPLDSTRGGRPSVGSGAAGRRLLACSGPHHCTWTSKRKFQRAKEQWSVSLGFAAPLQRLAAPAPAQPPRSDAHGPPSQARRDHSPAVLPDALLGARAPVPQRVLCRDALVLL